MLKKLGSLILSLMMLSVMLVGCGKEEEKTVPAKEASEAKVTTKGDYQYISAEDVAGIDQKADQHVVDLREWKNYVKGRLLNSEWKPIFPLEDANLAKELGDFAKEKLNDGKNIYLICNSGQKGAEKATGVLKEQGIDPKLIFTVEGGAKALAKVEGAFTTNRKPQKIDWQYVSGEDTIKDTQEKKNDNIQLLDVRDDKNFDKGHLKYSLHQDLTKNKDPEYQTKMFEFSKTLDKNKPVYILCYVGDSCAKGTISVFKDAGWDTNNLKIVEKGAKDSAIKEHFIKD